MSNYLNHDQEIASKYIHGPLAIIAGAGTGKTETMICRTKNILKSQNISPSNILLATFTHQASFEIIHRLVKETNIEYKNFEYVGTFHKICIKILSDYKYQKATEKSAPSIMKRSQQLSLLKDLCKENHIQIEPKEIRNVLSSITLLKNQNIFPENIQEAETNKHNPHICIIYSKYQEYMQKNQLYDYDDIIIAAKKLVKNDQSVRLKIQNQFSFLMVDEYQDISILQNTWLYSVIDPRHNNICVVGDPNQTIYTWRGACPDSIKKFCSDFPNVKKIYLQENYRSYQSIINTANKIKPYNESKYGVFLKAWHKFPGEVHVIPTYNDIAECQNIISIINNNSSSLSKAIFVRNSWQFHIIESYLSYGNIPYMLHKEQKFFDRKEIKDMLLYVRAILANFNDFSLAQIINIPKRGIGQKTLAKILSFAHSHKISLYEALSHSDIKSILTKKSYHVLMSFKVLLEKWRGEISHKSPNEILHDIMHSSGYYAYLVKNKEERKILSLEDLLRSVESFSSLHDYVLKTSIENEEHSVSCKNSDIVHLMTLHAAKGLEFDIVICPGWNEKIFPAVYAYTAESLQEERRLAYVAITRAKQKIYILFSHRRNMMGKIVMCQKSRFIDIIQK